MPSHDDVVSALRALGIRAPADALRAMIAHLTKSRASAVQCFEDLVALERRERDTRNLESRTKAATVGAFKSLDQFDWNHRYARVDLLALDELGYLPCDARSADLLYNLISRRHEQRATVISTNLAYKQWGTVFPGAACVGALVDRFAQHCHHIDIDADSWRNKEAAERAARKKPRA